MSDGGGDRGGLVAFLRGRDFCEQSGCSAMGKYDSPLPKTARKTEVLPQDGAAAFPHLLVLTVAAQLRLLTSSQLINHPPPTGHEAGRWAQPSPHPTTVSPTPGPSAGLDGPEAAAAAGAVSVGSGLCVGSVEAEAGLGKGGGEQRRRGPGLSR